MKKGINVWSFPAGTVRDTLALAKAAGFEGVELALNGEGFRFPRPMRSLPRSVRRPRIWGFRFTVFPAAFAGTTA